MDIMSLFWPKGRYLITFLVLSQISIGTATSEGDVVASGKVTGLSHLTVSGNIYIEKELLDEIGQDFITRDSDQRTTIKHISSNSSFCPQGPWPSSSISIYFGIDSSPSRLIHKITCEANLTLILIPSFLQGSVASSLSSFLDPSMQYSKSVLNLCLSGSLKSSDLSCGSPRNLQELSLEENYSNLKTTSIIYAILSTLLDSRLNSEVHIEMINDLYAYVFDQANTLTNTVTNSDEFYEVYECIIGLMNNPIGIYIEISDENLNKLLWISNSALAVNDPNKLLNHEGINMVKIADFYLVRFRNKYSPISDEFLAAVDRANRMINDFFVFVAAQGRLNEFSKVSVWSSEGGIGFIGAETSVVFGDLMNCTCDFCDSEKILINITVSYGYYGPHSEIVSVAGYVTGEVRPGPELFYYEKPLALSSTDSCFKHKKRVIIDHYKEISWQCLKSDFTNDCKFLGIDGDYANIEINQFGLFLLKKVCHSQFGYDSTGLSCNPGCLENCYCEYADICSVCNYGYSKDSQSTCTECNLGFGKNQDGKCVECPLNCGKCDEGVCHECLTGYLFDQGTCLNCSPGYRWNKEFKCICESGLVLDYQGLCSPCQENCECYIPGNCDFCAPAYQLAWSETGSICSQCAVGYTKDEAGKCLPCGPNCECSIPGLCDSCLNPYEKDSETSCNRCKSGYIKNQFGKCNNCDNGYYKDGDLCVKCMDGCHCWGGSRCEFCLSGFTSDLSSSSQMCAPCKENCYCFIPDTCYSCLPGWAKGPDDSCLKCDDHCICSKPGLCDYCEGGYEKDKEGKCSICMKGFGKDFDGTCQVCLYGCECSKAFTCDRCIDGYSFDGLGNCQPCKDSCKCSRPWNCDSCLDTYGFNDYFQCMPCAPNCLCSKAGQCESCIENYNFVDGKCQICSEAYFDEYSMCTKCSDGFGHQSDKCHPCDDNCLCMWSFGCDSCKIGYAMDENYRCSLCAPGFGRSQKSLCEPCSRFCLCSESQKCDSCLPGYAKDLKGFCNICDEGFDNRYGMECVDCLIGYYKNENGKCIKCANNCKCFFEGNCDACLDGYYFDETRTNCIKCLIEGCGCMEADRCDWCISGYGFGINMVCEPCRDNCLCDQYGKCNACQIGYLKDEMGGCSSCIIGYGKDEEGKCQPCVSGCFCEFASDCDGCISENEGINQHNYCSPCPAGCFCTFSNKCDSCPDGYGLGQDDLCEQCLNNCICQIPSTCLDCIHPYEKDSYGRCTLCKKGYSMDYMGKCSICAIGYSLSYETMKCEQCSLGCTCSEQSQCSDCILGYGWLDFGMTCAPCKQGCFCTWAEKCYGCLSGYTNYGINFECLPCAENCECRYPGQCDFCKIGYEKDFNEECSLCSKGYGMSKSSECLSCAPNCECEFAGECSKCLPGYYKNETTSQCIICRPGCECSNEYDCLSCIDGYYMNQHQECIKCSENCKCSGNSDCTSCLEDYQNLESKCLNCPIGYSSSFWPCQECQKGYYLAPLGKCQKCQYGCECLYSQKCTSCLFGFYYDNFGSCTHCPYPLLSDEDGHCRNCEKGFYFDLLDNRCLQCLDGCACTSYSKCDYCLPGYISLNNNLDNMQCLPCLFGCACLAPQTCLYCLDGFSFDPVMKVCVQCPPNCICSSPSICDSCILGYIKSENNNCDKCLPGYATNGYYCRPCKPNCLCNFPGNCDECKEGYWMDIETRICKKCDLGCICDTKGTCSKCIDGFALAEDGSCKACLKNCLCQRPNTCDSCQIGALMDNSGLCSICKIGYQDIDGICDTCKIGFGKDLLGMCSECLQGCTCETAGECDKCLDGFGINDIQTCDKCKDNCLCQESGTCDSCISGYGKTNEKDPKCSPCGQNCLCSEVDECDSCLPGFRLVRLLLHQNEIMNLCEPCDDGFVYNPDLSECQQCEEGCKCFSRDECSECLSNNIMDESGKCTICKEGFTKDQLSRCNICPIGKSYFDLISECVDCLENCECKFILTSEGYESRCEQCNSGFGFSDRKDKCQPCLKNCECFYAQMCDKCKPGYAFDDYGNCSRCSKNYSQLPDGSCKKCDDNCYCDSYNSCVGCIDGFGLSSKGICEPCIQGCYCKKSGTCDYCFSSYAFSNSICLPCLENCECSIPFTCSFCSTGYKMGTDGKCSECAYPYIFNPKTGKCDECSSEYKKDINGFCSNCADGYGISLYGWNCVPCRSGCFCKYSENIMPSCDGCLESFETSLCNKCKFGYESKQTACDSCIIGYGRDYFNNCVPCKENCYCDHGNSCLGCLTGFYYNTLEKICKSCQIGCVCNNENECLGCQEGYFATSKKQCIKCKQGCMCNEQTSCINCIDGYSYYSECKPCKLGYYLSYSFSSIKCYECKPGCICSDENECNACLDGYAFDIESNICQKCLNGCRCNMPNTCESCLSGFGINPSIPSECQPCQKNCFCSTAYSCSSCLPGYSFGADQRCNECASGYLGIYSQYKDGNSIAFELICKVCRPGYYKFMDDCLPCPDGCECSISNQCSACLPEYIGIGDLMFPDSFYCSKCEENCDCTHSGQCNQCLPGYQFDDNGKCLKCLEGYGLNKKTGKCEPCSMNCLCSEAWKCDSCIDIYKMDPEGLCTICSISGKLPGPFGECDKCKPGSYYNELGVCSPCKSGCECTDASNCLACIEGYFLDSETSACLKLPLNCFWSNSHEKCLVCQDGYYLSEGMCIMCNSNCYCSNESDLCSKCLNSILVDGKCQSCLPGFAPDQKGECLKCKENCFCSAPGTCDGCLEGYSLNSEGSCFSCDSGYYFSQNKCLKCKDFCYCNNENSCITCFETHRFSNQGDCTSCEFGYRQDQHGSCTLCDFGYIQGSDGTCSICDIGYTKDSFGLCKPCDSNCECSNPNECSNCLPGYIKSFEGRCDICQPGFALDSNKKCQLCKKGCECEIPDDCLKCRIGFSDDGQGSCSVCQDGFAFDEKGECLPCNKYCKCTSPNTCDSCTEGHTFSSNNDCTACADGFGYSFMSNDYCQPCQANCLCQDSNKCDQCAEGYEIWNSQCLNCLPGFVKVDSKCVSCGLNCICEEIGACFNCTVGYRYDLSGECSLCSEGFGLVSGTKKCDICGEYCTCESAGECTGCIYGYVLTNGFCMQGSLYFSQSYLISFEFDELLLHITLKSSKPIDPSGVSTSCYGYFQNYYILGTGAICTLKDKFTLTIVLGADWSVSSTNGLYIEDLFRVTEGDFILFPFLYLTPSLPENLDSSPHPQISGPAELTLSCQSQLSAYFTASSSYGILKHRFTFEWTTKDPVFISDPYKESIQVLIDTEITFFQLTVSISNGFGSNTQSTHNVKIRNSKLISFIFDVGQSVIIKRSQPLVITPVNIDFCGTFGVPEYIWTVQPALEGITLSQNKLRVPANSFAYGTFQVNLKIKLGNLEGTSYSTLQVQASELVPSLNKGNQEISNLLDFEVSAAQSYDPDGYALTYTWMIGSEIIAKNSLSSSLVVSKDLFSTLSNFDLTLVLNSEQGLRSSSLTINLIIKPDLKMKVSVASPTGKAVLSFVTNLKSIASKDPSIKSLSYSWTQISGPVIPDYNINGQLLSSMSISKFTLIGGASYGFKLTVVGSFVSGKSGSTSIDLYFTANLPAFCSGSAHVNPISGIQQTTKFTLSVSGCLDLDLVDLPLTYKAYFGKYGKLSIIGTSKNSIVTNLPLVVGVDTLAFDVCDSLSDCYFTSTPVSVSKSRRAEEFGFMDLYTEIKIEHGTTFAITIMLNYGSADLKALDSMWSDLIQFVEEEQNAIEDIASVLSAFLNDNQDLVFKKDRAALYAELLIKVLDQTNILTAISEDMIIEVVHKISELNEVKFRVISINILNELSRVKRDQGQTEGNLVSQNISYVTSEKVFEELVMKEINSGNIHVSLTDLAQMNDVIRVVVCVVDDIFSIKITKTGILLDGVYENSEEESIKIPKNSVMVRLNRDILVKGHNFCSKIDSGLSKSCSITDSDDDFITLAIRKNGIYTLQQENEKDSSSQNFIPFYIMLSISLFTVIISSLLKYLPVIQQKAESATDTTIVTNKSFGDIGSKDQLETQTSGLPRPNFHLILGMFTSNSLISKHLIPWIILSNICLEIIIQNTILSLFEMNIFATGCVSALITLPYSMCMSLMMSKQGRTVRIISMLVIVSVILASLVGVCLIRFSDGWQFSMIIGFFTEILVNQTLIMLGFKAVARIN